MEDDIQDIMRVVSEDSDRESKIDKLCRIGMLSKKEKQEISDFTQEFGGNLSGPYVWEQLHLDNNEVTTYRQVHDQTCFSVYKIRSDDEERELILELKAICSSGRKEKKRENDNVNLLRDQFSKLKIRKRKTDGDFALFDLEYRLRTILSSEQFAGFTAKIQLDAINIEYVVAFYVKNGYNFDRTRTLEESSLLPMKKLIKKTPKWKSFLQAFERSRDSSRGAKLKAIYKFQKEIFDRKTFKYKGINMSGQTYFTYSDGSYSYLNRDWSYRMSSIHHREPDGTVEFIRIPPHQRKAQIQESCDESSDSE